MSIEIFAAGRQMGKTTKAIEWLVKDEGIDKVLVFPNYEMAQMTYRSFREFYNVSKSQFIPYKGLPRGRNVLVGIDNFDLCDGSFDDIIRNVDFITVDLDWFWNKVK